VSVSLSCSSGTVTNNPQLASEASAAKFTIEGAAPGATCTATENPVPAGYTANESSCQNGDPLNGSCTIVNTLNEVPVDEFTVYKDFSDNNSTSVSVSLSCSSGTVTNTPQNASEASPAVFNIEGAAPGATCTATENSVPSGYTKNESGCQNGDPLNGSCTIVNNLDAVASDSFWVIKNFSDDNPASVSITLNCTSGAVTNNPQLASEASAAKFTIEDAVPGATCTATENPVPAGYTANESSCQNGDPLNSSCTIINTPEEDSFWVFKDFSDNNSASVSVSLSCTRGTVTNNPQLASEASPAVFNITGSNPTATCTATENSVPPGYTADQSECQEVPLIAVGGCEIFNTAVEPSDDMLFKGGFEAD